LLTAGRGHACVPERAKGEPVQARLAAVMDGMTLSLADGSTLRLAGLLAPPEREPFGHEAKAGLAALIAGAALRLYPMEMPADRYGRRLAQVYVLRDGAPPLWLQGALLDQGLARVFTTSDNRSCAAALLAREAAARAAGHGLWALPAYAVRDAARLAPADIGHFVLVEGRVLSVAARSKTAYLDYGRNWRFDFTVEIAQPDLALFRAEGYDLASLAGHAVRVRGWLEKLNGPMIAVTHPEQIERLAGQ
jgi:endonuclease YncB( thermonuclease family)